MSYSSRPSRVEIDLSALRGNIRTVRSWVGTGAKFMAVVKADAYGHGAVEVSRVASEERVDFLGVALLEEAQELKGAGISTPTAILYPESPERTLQAAVEGFYVTISDLDILKQIKECLIHENIPLKYFIKVETGMNRYGIQSDEITSKIKSYEISMEPDLLGVTTNLADPNGIKSGMARKQVESFKGVMESIRKYSNNGLHYSLESSGALWKKKKADGSLVRIGHLLYGLVPNGDPTEELIPVMSVKTRVAEIHDVKAGEGIGYGFTFVAHKDMRIATLPMGYADGYPWSASNKGFVIIRGRRVPIVGKVCMDAFMVDVTDLPECLVGDDVVVLGKMGDESVTAHELGRWAGSFSYEILSRWSKRLPRIYS